MKIFGILVVLFGMLVFLLGSGVAVFRLLIEPSHFLCQDADKLKTELDELTRKTEAAKGTPSAPAIEIERANKFERWRIKNQACGEMETNQQFWGIVAAVVGVGGLFIFIAGAGLTFWGFKRKRRLA